MINASNTKRVGALAFAATLFVVAACSGGGGATTAPSAAPSSGARRTRRRPRARRPRRSAERRRRQRLDQRLRLVHGRADLDRRRRGAQGRSNPDFNYTIEGPGTGDGFKRFCAGETDIADASRTIKDEEADALPGGRHRVHRAQGRLSTASPS